jgi:hypothetical protein
MAETWLATITAFIIKHEKTKTYVSYIHIDFSLSFGRRDTFGWEHFLPINDDMLLANFLFALTMI